MEKQILSFIISIILIFTFNIKTEANEIINSNLNFGISSNLELKDNYDTISYNSKSNNFLWVTNIFIAGFSQILMGDLNRGLKFLYIELGLIALDILIILGFQPLASLFLAPSESMKGLAIQVILVYTVIILIIINKLWSIIDAINMNKEIQDNNLSIKLDNNNNFSIGFNLLKKSF